MGTGIKVDLIDNATTEIIETYTLVIFSDVNGDGSIDSLDAGILFDTENYLTAINQNTGMLD